MPVADSVISGDQVPAENNGTGRHDGFGTLCEFINFRVSYEDFFAGIAALFGD